jgi:hypothetical protein
LLIGDFRLSARALMIGVESSIEDRLNLVVAVAAGVAVIGVIRLLLLICEPSTRAEEGGAMVASIHTAVAAKAAGATVSPTDANDTWLMLPLSKATHVTRFDFTQ